MTFVCMSSLFLARGTFSLCWEDPLEKERAIHSGILAWEIPWTEEPGGLQSMGWQRVGYNSATEHTRTFSWPMSKTPHSAPLSPTSPWLLGLLLHSGGLWAGAVPWDPVSLFLRWRTLSPKQQESHSSLQGSSPLTTRRSKFPGKPQSLCNKTFEF